MKTQTVMPTRTLLQGQPYRPSWLYRPPATRYVVDRLNGKFGPHKPALPDGDAHQRDPGEPDAHGREGMGCGS